MVDRRNLLVPLICFLLQLFCSVKEGHCLYGLMEYQTAANLVWADDTQLITFDTFPNNVPNYEIRVNDETPLTVNPFILNTGNNWAVSWISQTTNSHLHLFTVAAPTSSTLVISIPKTLSRVYVAVYIPSATGTLSIFSGTRSITQTSYFSMWDFSSGTPSVVWEGFINARYGSSYDSFEEVSNGIVAVLYSFSGKYQTSPGNVATYPSWSGGVVAYQKLDFSGNNLWISIVGSDHGDNINAQTAVVDSTANSLCSFIAAASDTFSEATDLDPSQTTTIDYGDTVGTPSNYWSLFLFCWDMSASTPLAPIWTHSISSSDYYSDLTTTYQELNAWGGVYPGGVLIQACRRESFASISQGLIWPDGFTLASPPVDDAGNVYVFGSNAMGVRLWGQQYAVTADQGIQGIVAQRGCTNIALIMEQITPVNSFDYSFGTNPALGTFSPTVDSIFVIILNAATGDFVNLVPLGVRDSLYSTAGGRVNSACEFIITVLLTSFSYGGCTFPAISPPYKLMIRMDQAGNILDSPPPSCFTLSPTSSATPTISLSSSVTASATISLSSSVTASATISLSSSSSVTASATISLSSTRSNTPTSTISETRTVTPSKVPSISNTITPTISESAASSVSESLSPSSEPCVVLCKGECFQDASDCVSDSDSVKTIAEIIKENDSLPSSYNKALPDDWTSVEVVPLSVKITGGETEVPIYGSTEEGKQSYYGQVTIPRGTFPNGWTVVISNASTKALDKPTKDKCGGSSSSSDDVNFQSMIFNVEVYDRDGNLQDIKNLPGKGMEFELVITLPQSLDDEINRLDFSFLGDDSDFWESVGANEIVRLQTKKPVIGADGERMSVWLVRSSIDHLTSFAVLLGPPDGNDGCGSDNTLWIISVSFLATAIVLSFLIGLTYQRFAIMRFIVYGYQIDKKKELDSLGRTVASMKEQTQSTV